MLSDAVELHNNGTTHCTHHHPNVASEFRMLLCFHLAVRAQGLEWWDVLSMAVAICWQLLRLGSQEGKAT